MALPSKKDGPNIVLAFGPSKGKGKPSQDDDDSRELLRSAFGWDDDKIDALHEYIKSCVGEESSEPPGEADEEYEK